MTYGDREFDIALIELRVKPEGIEKAAVFLVEVGHMNAIEAMRWIANMRQAKGA